MDQTNQTKDPDEVGQIKQTEEFERFRLSLDLLLTFTHLPLVLVDFPVAYYGISQVFDSCGCNDVDVRNHYTFLFLSF